MLLHLLKRLLLAIPILWLLGTAVFLLSRTLPGSFGEERFLNPEAGFYSKSSQSSREAAWEQLQQKTGQHLPLFYFSISSAALPDTLQNVQPSARREQLQQLAIRYGNWPAVAAFDLQVEKLVKALEIYPAKGASKSLQELRYRTNISDLQKAINKLSKSDTSPAVAPLAVAVSERIEVLNINQSSYTYLVPRITWNGTTNQYHHWLVGILTGDFSTSYRTSQPVLEMILEGIGNTFWLLLCSMVVTLLLALELSILMAKKKLQWLRRLLLPALFAIDSIPMLVLAILLLVLLANPDFIQLFPVYGMGYYQPTNLSFWQNLSMRLQFMALPLIALVLVNLPYITNQIYTSLQASLQADYTRTARAKGLPEHLVIRRHALCNALLPIITIVSDFIPALVSGSVLIETIYAIPGVGRLLVESVMARDYPVLVAIILVVLLVRMVAYALADAAYFWADPRMKQKAA